MPVRNTISNRWLFISATQGVIAVSKKAADSFGPMGSLIREKLSIIYSSVDTKGFNPLRRCVNWRKQHGVGEDEPLIGLIARLQRVKGQQQFLQAAAIILKEFPRARFLVAGIGQPHKRARLEQYADQLGIREHIIFQDWLPDVHTVTASLDVGVLASLGSEGSSRVTYEYMASGVAVVATSVGCIPEVIEHGHTGLVVPPGNPEAMAEAIIETLRSPEARKEMQIRALARIELNHNRAKWVNATVDCYTRAVNLKAHKKWNWSGFVATAQGILTGKSVSEDDAYPSPPLNEAKG
jgi:glycosyltransferase involved in cell wall biosynthesis